MKIHRQGESVMIIRSSEYMLVAKTAYLTTYPNYGQVCKRPREQPAYQRHISGSSQTHERVLLAGVPNQWDRKPRPTINQGCRVDVPNQPSPLARSEPRYQWQTHARNAECHPKGERRRREKLHQSVRKKVLKRSKSRDNKDE
jgi:hypothetical protein